jgi:hypothetical protein
VDYSVADGASDAVGPRVSTNSVVGDSESPSDDNGVGKAVAPTVGGIAGANDTPSDAKGVGNGVLLSTL